MKIYTAFEAIRDCEQGIKKYRIDNTFLIHDICAIYRQYSGETKDKAKELIYTMCYNSIDNVWQNSIDKNSFVTKMNCAGIIVRGFSSTNLLDSKKRAINSLFTYCINNY